jgi:hypothetical protein
MRARLSPVLVMHTGGKNHICAVEKISFVDNHNIS